MRAVLRQLKDNSVLKRAAWTFLQSALAVLATSDRLTQVNWQSLVDVAGMAFLISCICGVCRILPEDKQNGMDSSRD